MALPAEHITDKEPQTTGTLLSTVVRVRVHGFGALEVTASTATAYVSLRPGTIATGEAAPSGVQANGIPAGSGRTFYNPRPGREWDLLLWGNTSVVDLQGVP